MNAARPIVYYLARDLFFGVRLAEGLNRLEVDARPARAMPELSLEGGALLLVDLSSPPAQWQPLIEGAHSRGVPVLAFGSHMDQPRWQLARAAGAAHIVANSYLLEHFSDLVGRLLRQPAS